MFEGGLKGFIDDVVNTVRCVGADVGYRKSQLRRVYYQQFDEESEKGSEESGIKTTGEEEPDEPKEE